MFAPCGLWETSASLLPAAGKFPNRAEFPRELADLCCVVTATRDFFNKDHPLVLLVKEEDYWWVRDTITSINALLAHGQDIAGDVSKSAAVLLCSLRQDWNWNGLRDNHPDLFRKLLDCGAVGGTISPIYFWKFGTTYGGFSETGVLMLDGLHTKEDRPLDHVQEINKKRVYQDRLDMPDGCSLCLPSAEEWWISAHSDKTIAS
jgi:hypothetical protein